MSKPIAVTIVGGGMITNDLLLPAVYHLQRGGVVGEIRVCALNSAPLKELKESAVLAQAFPGQQFIPYPALSEPADRMYPDLYQKVIAEMPPRQVVVVAVPDQFHYEVVMTALRHNQHVLCVKPLVLEYRQTVEVEKLALEKGLFVGVEYHKRFDRRSLIAAAIANLALRRVRLRRSPPDRATLPPLNFQNWFTVDKTDPFVHRLTTWTWSLHHRDRRWKSRCAA